MGAGQHKAIGPGWWHQPGLKGALVTVGATNRDQCSVYISHPCENFWSVLRSRPDDAARLPLCASPSPSSPLPPTPSRAAQTPSRATQTPSAPRAPCLLVARRRAPHRRRRGPLPPHRPWPRPSLSPQCPASSSIAVPLVSSYEFS